MDEQLELLKQRPPGAEGRRAGLGLMLSAGLVVISGLAAGCRTTEVALVMVSNETAASLHVRSRLRGYADFEDTFDLAPTEERPLIKYEEGRSSVEPIVNLVLGLQLATAEGCVAQLAGLGLVVASTRAKDRRHWTVHLRPEDLPGIRCPPGTPASPPSALTMPPVRTAVPGATAVPPATPAPTSVTAPPHVPPAPPPAREEKQIKN